MILVVVGVMFSLVRVMMGMARMIVMIGMARMMFHLAAIL